MEEKIKEKETAIKLRKKGLSYSEILKKISVAKSTLSLWLRSVGLSKRQKQVLTENRKAAALRGAEAQHKKRIALVEKINKASIKDIKRITKRELWLIGVILYWAEGTKDKEYRPGRGTIFTNSDPYMIKMFLKWLFEIAKVKTKEIKFDIFLHENNKPIINKMLKYWLKVTGLSKRNFANFYFKKHKILTKRKNTGDAYHGVLKIRVRKSSILNRRIAGWVRGINKYFWKENYFGVV